MVVRTCSMQGIQKHAQYKDLKGKYFLGDLGVDGRILLKLILTKQVGLNSTGSDSVKVNDFWVL